MIFRRIKLLVHTVSRKFVHTINIHPFHRGRNKQEFLMPLSSFISTRLQLLKLEHKEELEAKRILQKNLGLSELAENKLALIDLDLVDQRESGKHSLCTFTFRENDDDLDLEFLQQGEPVDIIETSGKTKHIIRGTVLSLAEDQIEVFVDRSVTFSPESTFHILKVLNVMPYQRKMKHLQKLEEYADGPAFPLFSLFFSALPKNSPLKQGDDWYPDPSTFYNPNLDSAQKEAVKFALRQSHLAVIHGPPGTGKTTTIAELICQAVKRGQKVLVCTPSNVALDNIAEKLLTFEHLNIVRVGHRARINPSVYHQSLEHKLTSSQEFTLVRYNERKAERLQSLARNKTTNAMARAIKKRAQLLAFRQELKIFHHANVVLSTLVLNYEALFKHVPLDHFDLLIIDEASQAIEPACWMPMVLVPKCVLAGDHFQLPPTIFSERAVKEGLSITLMDRALYLYGDSIKKSLNLQYRMHHKIMNWSSQMFYGGKLRAHPSVSNHLLRDIPGVEDNVLTSSPLLLLDTYGLPGFEESIPDDDELLEESFKNNGEANVVEAHVRCLVSFGVAPSDIGVISPYTRQVKLIKARLSHVFPDLEIKSIDGFQGRQKEAIVCSLVRSNKHGEIGFLKDTRRINVALTRARRHLTVVCDSTTFDKHPVFTTLIEYFQTHGLVQHVDDFTTS